MSLAADAAGGGVVCSETLKTLVVNVEEDLKEE